MKTFGSKVTKLEQSDRSGFRMNRKSDAAEDGELRWVVNRWVWEFKWIRYQGAKIWKDISDDVKLLPGKHFKKKIISNTFASY